MANRLAWKDRFLRVAESSIESDTEGAILAPFLLQDEPNKLLTNWTGAQYTKMFSALYTGAHLMFPEEAAEIIWQFLRPVHQPITFDNEEVDCINYPPSTPFIYYYPQNPYTQPDFTPDDYLVPPFFVNSEFGYPSEFGYLASDVFINSGALNIDPIDLITLNLPQIQIKVKGSGQIELDLLSVASGSMAVIKAGSPPNIIDIIDGIADTGATVVDLELEFAIPPESDIVHNHEENIEAESGVETILYVVFVPVVDDSLIPLRLGGGIRQIGLCGFEEASVLGYVEDVRFDVDEMMLQQRKNGIYEDIIDWEFFINYVFDIEDDVMLLDAIVDNHSIDLIDLQDQAVAIDDRLSDVETLQATHDTSIANLASRMDAAEGDIDALDARLDALENADSTMWNVHYDFKTGEHGFGGGSGVSWASTVGYSWSTSPVVIAKSDSSFLDGRIAFYRLELRKVGAGEQDYTVKIVPDTYSYGVAESGLNIRYHKLQNLSSREDLEIQFAAAGSWILEGITIFGYGDSNAYDD